MASVAQEPPDRRLDRVDLGLRRAGRIPPAPVDDRAAGRVARPARCIHATSCSLVRRPAAPPYRMKFRWPSRHGQKTRYCAPVTERPVMNAPARVGVVPSMSKNAGACESAVMTAAWAETSTSCPRPVRRAIVERHERADRRLRARPRVGLRRAHPHRRAIGFARERHRAARRHDLEVGGEPVRLRAGQAERRDGTTTARGWRSAQADADRAAARCPPAGACRRRCRPRRQAGRTGQRRPRCVDSRGVTSRLSTLSARQSAPRTSAPGASILTTSAPRSASSRPASQASRSLASRTAQPRSIAARLRPLAYRPVRASDSTQPSIRAFIFSISSCVEEVLGLDRSTG